jgi:hypothetical protein
MSTPREHKIVQGRILAYTEAIDWTVVSREGANGPTNHAVASQIAPSALANR